ncbi:hypothetical protein KI387_032679, partial [Taxus chinensis]
ASGDVCASSTEFNGVVMVGALPPLKGNLKKSCLAAEKVKVMGRKEHATNGRRKVQWTDAYGKDLTEIKEFEASVSYGSDDDDDNMDATRPC